MEFLVVAFDRDDKDVGDRRIQARAAHIAFSRRAIKRGEQLVGVDILDGKGKVRGSALIVDFPSIDAVDEWIANESYITGKVWSKVEVYPCKVSPRFTHRFNN